jgi:hypothetical protein
LKGLIELTIGKIEIPFGPSPSSYCVLPGKRKEGYCSEKEYICTSAPFSAKPKAKELLKFAIPPLYGKAGPIMITFLFKI